MNPVTKLKLIQKAKEELYSAPYDAGHELTHHYKVWDNCIHIIYSEEVTDIDRDNLELAAWWHDVDRSSQDHPRFVAVAKELGVNKETISNILEIINTHSFKDERSNLTESKVLFDADKIEYINPARWLVVNNHIQAGEMTVERGLRYCSHLNDRFNYVIEHLSFDSSKQLFHQYRKEFIQMVKTGMLLDELTDAIDLELLESA